MIHRIGATFCGGGMGIRMKKINQTDLDFDVINLDETAGWDRLEVETALEEEPVFVDEELVFEEEPEYGEEESAFMQEEMVELSAPVVKKKKKTASGKKKSTTKAAAAVKSTGTKKRTSATRKKSAGKKQEVVWTDKIKAMFADMSALDGVVALTGVMVLVVAIITVSVFSGAKTAQKQVEAFAPLGEEMSYLSDAGKGTLLAMADSKRLIQDEEEIAEETFEYEEKELETATTNVNMKMTSVQKDLKIKFVNSKTGKLIPNVAFKVSIENAKGKTKEYTDDDKDGIIYLKDMTPGKVSVTMLALSGQEGLAFNTAPQTITIKDQIEYKKIDVSDEVKSENEINAAIEDTAKANEVEAVLTDTVEWVESTKTEVGSKDSYVEVKKSDISAPVVAGRSSSEKVAQPVSFSGLAAAEAFFEVTSSADPSSSSEGENSPEPSSSEPSSSAEPTTPEPTSSVPESSGEPTTPESTSTPETSSEAESSTTPPTTTTTTTPPSSATPDDPAKSDTKTPLKDKSGNALYLKKSDGSYRAAAYADYYNDSVVFYKKVTSASAYKYTGWQNINGKTYFYDKNGNVVTGEQVIQGARYNFASDGALITGSGTMGIDVSKWNGNIDWNAVKNAGVSYVIIRCGYRGSTTGAMIEDPKFKANIKGANAAGLKVGIYFFSQAVNEVEAVEEASMTINLIKNYSISYPVFLDVEPSGGRADGIDRNTRTKVIKAYCETIRNSGYTAGVYANKTWLSSYMNAGELSSYKIWLAQYNTTPTYSGKIDMWQYTSKGKVNGISGNTDLNLSYLGY